MRCRTLHLSQTGVDQGYSPQVAGDDPGHQCHGSGAIVAHLKHQAKRLEAGALLKELIMGQAMIGATAAGSLGSVCPALSHAFCCCRCRSRRVVQFGTQRNFHDARRLVFRNKWSDQCKREIARLQRRVRNVRQMSMHSSSRLLPKGSSSIQMS
jgi:hypothetical protein